MNCLNARPSAVGGETMNTDNAKTELLVSHYLQRKAKAKAAMMGISLKELIIRAITEYIKKAS